MYRLMCAKNVSISNFKYSTKRNWNFCCSCGNLFDPTRSTAVPSKYKKNAMNFHFKFNALPILVRFSIAVNHTEH